MPRTRRAARLPYRGPHPDVLSAEYDLVVAADGVHSPTRETYAHVFRPHVAEHHCRYIWLAADFAFDAFRFEIAETEHGVMQLHGYPYAADASTVIIEMREEVWRAAGLDELPRGNPSNAAPRSSRRPSADAPCAPTTAPGPPSARW